MNDDKLSRRTFVHNTSPAALGAIAAFGDATFGIKPSEPHGAVDKNAHVLRKMLPRIITLT